MNQRQKGAVYVFVAAVLYSLGGLCIKVIPWNGMAINGGRTAIALLVLGAYLIWIRHPLRFNFWVLVGAVSVFSTNALFSVANKLTTAANAIVLQYTVPMFVMLFSAVCFRKRPGRLDVMACVVIFGGVLCFFVDSLAMGSLCGDLVALLSGMTYAGVFMMNDMPEGDALSSVFLGNVLSALTGLPFLLRETQFTPVALGSLVVLGVFQVGVAYICLCTGLKTTPPVTASLISGIEPVLNPVLVALFYGERIGGFSLVGAMIVVAGVVSYNVLKGRQSQTATST